MVLYLYNTIVIVLYLYNTIVMVLYLCNTIVMVLYLYNPIFMDLYQYNTIDMVLCHQYNTNIMFLSAIKLCIKYLYTTLRLLSLFQTSNEIKAYIGGGLTGSSSGCLVQLILIKDHYCPKSRLKLIHGFRACYVNCWFPEQMVPRCKSVLCMIASSNARFSARLCS